jgi:hypothetical protein
MLSVTPGEVLLLALMALLLVAVGLGRAGR